MGLSTSPSIWSPESCFSHALTWTASYREPKTEKIIKAARGENPLTFKGATTDLWTAGVAADGDVHI